MRCLAPIFLKPKDKVVKLPCGKCAECRKLYSLEWFLRLSYESQSECTQTWFLTLTYDEEHVTYQDVGDDTVQVLVVADVMRFIKSLRNYYQNKVNKKLGNVTSSFKYYLVGEYGTHTYRPHYHVLLFNKGPIADGSVFSSCWSCGYIDVRPGGVDGAIRYCSADIVSVLTPETRKWFKDNSVQPPFHRMSIGLGDGYIKRRGDWHRADITRTYMVLNGEKYPLPRYYKERIYTEAQRRRMAYQGWMYGLSADEWRDRKDPDWYKRQAARFRQGQFNAIQKNKTRYL